MRGVDVVVVGGGPAGAATALALARGGLTALVVERSTYTNARPGETLPPIVKEPLARLGVWEQFISEGHLPSYGTSSAWGAGHLRDHDFIFDPRGYGWHVDRGRFDSMLARAAEAAGARVHRDARLASCVRERPGEWRLKIAGRGESFEVRARFVVDATGRASSFARRQGAKRVSYDQLVGVVRFLSPAASAAEVCHTTLVEAVPVGWWYSAPLPDGRLSVALMTDADLYAAGERGSENFWRRQLLDAEHTRSRADSYDWDAPRLVFTADSALLDSAAGESWLAVGDAAQTVDPLSSQGICQALWSGIGAAKAVTDYLGGSESALADYARRARKNFESYLKTRRQFYSTEGRWPGSTFWRRRQSGTLETPAFSGPIRV